MYHKYKLYFIKIKVTPFLIFNKEFMNSLFKNKNGFIHSNEWMNHPFIRFMNSLICLCSTCKLILVIK